MARFRGNAPALVKLWAQVKAKFPNRSTEDDGMLGDVRHQARISDHNPNAVGIVTALDLTHDPRHGFNSYAFADYLKEQNDPRIKYVISNRRIWTPQTELWRVYTGQNPHDCHVHISVRGTPKHYNDASDWDLDGFPAVDDQNAAPAESRPTLRPGSQGDDVRRLQNLLGVAADGDFGRETRNAVKRFQTKHKLVSDGVVGPQTWRTLEPGHAS
jgi:Putative peptidoglycan binding domain